MDSTPNPRDGDPHHQKTSPAADELARAEDAIAKIVQEAGRPAANERPLTPQQSITQERPETHERPGANERLVASGRSGAARERPVPAAADFAAGPRIAAPAIEVAPRAPGHDEEPKSGGRRIGRSLLRSVCVAGIGVAATLVWQSYGEAPRQMIASFAPALLGVSSAAIVHPSPAGAKPDTVQAGGTGALPAQGALPALAAPDPALSAELAHDIKTMANDLAALRRSVEQLATGQEQLSRTIAKLQAAEEALRQKLAAPAPAPSSPPPPQPTRRQETRPQPPPQALAPGPRPLWQSFDTPPPRPQPRPPASMP
jgi:hypothetical protein